MSETLCAAMQRMLDAVQHDRCDGESSFAGGVNAACQRHTVGLAQIMTDAGVVPRLDSRPVAPLGGAEVATDTTGAASAALGRFIKPSLRR